MIFPGYNPFAACPKDEPELTEARKRKARERGASHISRDGEMAFVERYGVWLYSQWLRSDFGSWWWCEAGLPEKAVKL